MSLQTFARVEIAMLSGREPYAGRARHALTDLARSGIITIPEDIGAIARNPITRLERRRAISEFCYSTVFCAEVTMRRMLGVCVVLLTLAFLTTPSEAQGQGTGGQGRTGGLGQNYPNPFNPTTTIPFDLGPEYFQSGEPAVVTIRILNSLLQLVAIPTALNHPAGNRPEVEKLEYAAPGHYEAYWDGLDKDGRKVGSQRLIVLLEVNGRRVDVISMMVAK